MRNLVVEIGSLLLCLSLAQALQSQPLRLLPQNSRIFLYQGKPTLLIGSGEHYATVMYLGFDYQKYLATLLLGKHFTILEE